ncbi:MAG: hypothetical protein HY217_05680 [Candidatus Rokubacteria bacterium]|nr:hypothetical protein [Candidatus Rokubacteria bacterium]
MSAEARREYFKAIYPRYRQAGRREKSRILDEFCRVAGYRRKYAVRLLNGWRRSPRHAAVGGAR